MKDRPLFIGLGHYSRTGKDTFANYLIAEVDFLSMDILVVKRPLAWKLKQITHELYAWAGVKPPEHYDAPDGEKDRDVVLPALGMTPVELWVAFGTKAVRDNVYAATWLDYLLKHDHRGNVVIVPDVRFPNEADAIKATGGIVIKVVRPGYGPRNTVADRALLGYGGWDYVIGDRGGMDGLRIAAIPFARWIAGVGPKPVQMIEERMRALAVELKQDADGGA